MDPEALNEERARLKKILWKEYKVYRRTDLAFSVRSYFHYASHDCFCAQIPMLGVTFVTFLFKEFTFHEFAA